MTLGIDIGGTTISLGLVEGGQVVKEVCVPSFASNATQEQTLQYLAGQIEALFSPAVEKIGIGVPSVADPEKGIVYDAANIPSWDEVPLKGYLEARFGVPVKVNNDANCFALGAAAMLDGTPRTVVGVTLGTGTGVGIVVNGTLFSGSHCGAGEICSLAYNGADYESFCSKKFFTARGLNPKDVAIRAYQGDPGANALFWEFGHHMGELLTAVMYAYDADCILLGGGIAKAFPLFEVPLWDTLREKYPYHRSLEELTIKALSQQNLALIGAALL